MGYKVGDRVILNDNCNNGSNGKRAIIITINDHIHSDWKYITRLLDQDYSHCLAPHQFDLDKQFYREERLKKILDE